MMYARMYACPHACMYTIYTYAMYVAHVLMHEHVYVCMGVLRSVYVMYVLYVMYVCMYACTYIYIYMCTYACMYVCARSLMCVRVYVCIYVCM